MFPASKPAETVFSKQARTATQEQAPPTRAATPRRASSEPAQSVHLRTRSAAPAPVRWQRPARSVVPPSTRRAISQRRAVGRARVVPRIRSRAMVSTWSPPSLASTLTPVAGTGCGAGELACASGVCTSRAAQCQTAGSSLGIRDACPTRAVRPSLIPRRALLMRWTTER
jgi:hypothetical protein